MPRVPKLDHAMTATIARRMVKAGTKVLALLLGSIVLQSLVVHLERVGLWGRTQEKKRTLTGQHGYCH